MTLKELEQLLVIARSKGMGDDVVVIFSAGAGGVAPNTNVQIGAASNLVAGQFIEDQAGETVLQAPEIALNQA